uniref:Uncharacterized protein n=1 Tax=Rhizophagus irregularis (strain DAOM 181602 / DAOM 197198 / MUCL 43194) TaxID=747089 RepID=U9TEP3_RHIID
MGRWMLMVRRAFYVQNKRSSQLRAFKWNYWRSPLGENQEIYSGCNHSPQRRLLRASIASTSKDGRIQEVITISGAIEAVIEFDDVDIKISKFLKSLSKTSSMPENVLWTVHITLGVSLISPLGEQLTLLKASSTNWTHLMENFFKYNKLFISFNILVVVFDLCYNSKNLAFIALLCFLHSAINLGQFLLRRNFLLILELVIGNSRFCLASRGVAIRFTFTIRIATNNSRSFHPLN